MSISFSETRDIRYKSSVSPRVVQSRLGPKLNVQRQRRVFVPFHIWLLYYRVPRNNRFLWYSKRELKAPEEDEEDGLHSDWEKKGNDQQTCHESFFPEHLREKTHSRSENRYPMHRHLFRM
jgi:hypothetical protein